MGGRVGRRLNYEKPGFSGLFRKTVRRAGRLEAPYREAFVALDEKWGDIENWRVIKRESAPTRSPITWPRWTWATPTTAASRATTRTGAST